MVCIQCGAVTQVTNSRLQKRLNQVWRRRKCTACGLIFSTHEVVQYEQVWLVRTGKALTPFNRDKLLLSIYRSCQHRSDALSDASGLAETIITKLRGQTAAATLNSQVIAQTVQVALNRFDTAASTHYKAFHH